MVTIKEGVFVEGKEFFFLSDNNNNIDKEYLTLKISINFYRKSGKKEFDYWKE